VKADALVTDYQDGDTALSSSLKDYYLPSAIPVGAAAASKDPDFDAHAKQTRLSFTMQTMADGHKLAGYVEGDSQSSPGTQGTQRTTNGYNFAMRRAYVTFDNWQFGQDWSTFMSTSTMPETTDFIGPTEGTVFVRQVSARYTHKLSDKASLQFALENPETSTITPTSATMVENGDDSLPDAVVRLALKDGKPEFFVAGLVRQLSADTGPLSDEEWGLGLMAAAKFAIGERDDLRLHTVGGEGIVRYVGVNLAADAVLSAGQLEAIPLWAGYASYRHFWTGKTRSSLIVSMQQIDNPTIAALAANEAAWSAAVNLFTTPVKGLDLGVEYRHGERETVNGQEGAIDRVHMVAKHSF
jgi:hypothetical protein